jgi:hypothetical protein
MGNKDDVACSKYMKALVANLQNTVINVTQV